MIDPLSPGIYSMESEQAVLGSMLIDNGCITAVRAIVKPDTFYLPQHREICDVIFELELTDGKADPLTVLDQAMRCENFRDLYDEAGARNYLYQLAQMVPSTANVVSYAQIVARKAQVRDAATRASELLEAASAGQDISACRAAAEGILEALEEPEQREDPILKFIRTVGQPQPRILTGYGDIDRTTGGLRVPSLSCIGARTRVGKTAFALNIALRNIHANPEGCVVFFTLEMTTDQIMERASCITKHINYQWYSSQAKGHKADQYVEQAQACGYELLGKLKLYEDVYDVEQQAAIVAQIKPALVVVDYLQIVQTGRKTQDRRNEIDYICRCYKRMAKRNGCHVMMLSQMTRGLDETARPTISMLKESGAIEAESDYIYLLHRPKINSDIVEERGETTIYLDKNKFGGTGKVDLWLEGEHQRFVELDKRGEAPPPPLPRQQTEIQHSDFIEITDTGDLPF